MRVLPEPIESESKCRLADGATQYDPESTWSQFRALSPEERKRLRDEVVEACQGVAQNWPMKTFAYRNPLRGWEHLPFDEAIREAQHLLGGNGYISNEDYRQLFREGRITDDAVKRALQHVGRGIFATQTFTVVTGAMFLSVGQLYDRTHSRLIGDYGGLYKQMPRFVALLCLFSVASFGLPGTGSFIGEFLVLLACTSSAADVA